MPHSYFSGEPLVLAHRGASGYAPDHTLPALEMAFEQGADAIEVDVHLSRDGHPVLHHGGDLSENTEGRGPVNEYTLDQLRQFDAGYLFSSDDGTSYPYRGKGQQITTLAEALTTFPQARFNLDVKERRAARPTRELAIPALVASLWTRCSLSCYFTGLGSTAFGTRVSTPCSYPNDSGAYAW